MIRKLAVAVFWGLTVAATPPPRVTISPPPQALSEIYGDWKIVHVSDDLYIASTANSAGSVLGSICNKAGCTTFFNPAIKCIKGSQYAALINAPAAAFSVVLECEELDDLLFYSVPDSPAINEAMAVGGVLGIAFPMRSGEFKVSRFSLTGAARSTARALQLAMARGTQSPQNASDNFSL